MVDTLQDEARPVTGIGFDQKRIMDVAAAVGVCNVEHGAGITVRIAANAVGAGIEGGPGRNVVGGQPGVVAQHFAVIARAVGERHEIDITAIEHGFGVTVGIDADGVAAGIEGGPGVSVGEWIDRGVIDGVDDNIETETEVDIGDIGARNDGAGDMFSRWDSTVWI